MSSSPCNFCTDSVRLPWEEYTSPKNNISRLIVSRYCRFHVFCELYACAFCRLRFGLQQRGAAPQEKQRGAANNSSSVLWIVLPMPGARLKSAFSAGTAASYRSPFGFHHQSPMTRCISRLTAVMPAQQQAPSSSGLPPLFTSLTTLLFSPMAAIAMMMKNLLSSFSG